MKKTLIVLTTVVVLILMSACSAQPNANQDVALDELAKELLESDVFEEALTPADEGIAKKLYSIDNAVSFQLDRKSVV